MNCLVSPGEYVFGCLYRKIALVKLTCARRVLVVVILAKKTIIL